MSGLPRACPHSLIGEPGGVKPHVGGGHAEKEPRRARRRAATLLAEHLPFGQQVEWGGQVCLERNHSGQPPVLATSASASITLPCRVWTWILDATVTTAGGLSPMSNRSCSGRLTVRPTVSRSWMMTVRRAGFRGAESRAMALSRHCDNFAQQARPTNATVRCHGERLLGVFMT